MQEHTLFDASASPATVDIPAFGGKLEVSWNPESQVTQWGGMAYFISCLKTSGLFDRLVADAPFRYTSPNARKSATSSALPSSQSSAASRGTSTSTGCGTTPCSRGYSASAGSFAKTASAGHQRLLRLISTHLKAREIQASLMRIGEFMKRISAIAEQLD